MARTALTPKVPPGRYPVVPLTALSADLTFANSDNTNGNSVACTGREIILVKNNAGSSGTITIRSAADPEGRTGDITTYAVAAGVIAAFGPFPVQGWQQSDSTLWIDTSAATMQLVVLQPQGI